MASTPDGIVQLLNGATATNGAPSAATDGVALPPRWGDAVFLVRSTAGSGTMTVTIRLWVYYEGSANADATGWYPLGPSSTAGQRGLVNLETAIDESSADAIAHCERILALNAFARLYAEITAIGGTATAIDAFAAKPVGASDSQ